MRWPKPLHAEVLRRRDQSGSEGDHPESVDRDPCGQRVPGVEHPIGETESVPRGGGRKRRQDRGRRRLDGFAGEVVLTTREDAGDPRLGGLDHRHDLGRRVEGGGEFAPGFTEIGAGLTNVGIERGRIGGSQLVGRRARQRDAIVQMPDLKCRARPGEHAKVIDLAVLEAAIAEPLSDRHRPRATAGDRLHQMIVRDLGRPRLAVHEDREAVGAAGTVGDDGDVEPLADWKRGGPADRDRIARPEVDEREAGMPVLKQQFPALTARVGPRLRAVHDDGPLGDRRHLEAKRDRERVES